MYQWELALIHNPTLHIEVRVIFGCIVQSIRPRGILRQQDRYMQIGHPTKATIVVEAVVGSSPKRCHPRESALTQPKEDASNAVVEGIILLYNSWARILFDPSATHSFIRTTYALDLGLNFEKLEQALRVDLPTGEQLGTSRVCKGCVLRIEEHELIVDLVALDLKGHDTIFGIDLLSIF